MSLESSSSFNRFGHRDERRRRLLTDDLGETTHDADAMSRSSSTKAKASRYGNADFLNRQLHLFDFIPLKVLTLFLFLLAGAVIIAGLQAGFVWMSGRVSERFAIIEPLDITSRGSLASWISSLLLLGSAAMSVLIYAVRRHRADDYQGEYRVWFWTAAVWCLTAADLATGLHEWFRRTMISLSGTTLAGDGSLWWIAMYAILFVAVGTRLFVDMRSSRLSVFFFVLAAITCGLAVSSQWNWAFPKNKISAAVFRSSCELAAGLLLLLTLCAYARYVLLDALGRIPQREPKRKKAARAAKTPAAEKTEEKKPATSTGTWRKIDPPHTTPAPMHQPSSKPATASSTTSSAAGRPIPVHPAFATATPSVPSTSTSSDSSGSVNHKLSKAERRALKARLLREREERERR